MKKNAGTDEKFGAETNGFIGIKRKYKWKRSLILNRNVSNLKSMQEATANRTKIKNMHVQQQLTNRNIFHCICSYLDYLVTCIH